MTSAPKIVVIEDATSVLELIDAVLTEEGYLVVPCQDGTRGLETVIAEQPALVIADLRMAGVERWELVNALMSDSRTAHLPIIVCSGAVSELRAAEDRLLEHGGDVLVKPFDILALVGKVRRLLSVA